MRNNYAFPDELLARLLEERGLPTELPCALEDKRCLLRKLMNIRAPEPLSPDLLALQDMELARQRDEKGVVSLAQIDPLPKYPRLSLWQGDITRLEVDAIVNAANAALLGCFAPLHNCIDNVIHSAAGMQLREECARLMEAQGHDEETGKAKITRAYNLPCAWVIHTVGPIVPDGEPDEEDARLLASCYISCLELANAKTLKSIAFPCISTGVFGYPPRPAAKIALRTVLDYFRQEPETTVSRVIFNVFKDEDLRIYKELLS